MFAPTGRLTLLTDSALYRLRSAQGVIGLTDKHDPSRLEAACAKAITVGDPSYRTIKGLVTLIVPVQEHLLRLTHRPVGIPVKSQGLGENARRAADLHVR
jgi:hypothetical protein